MRAVAGVALVYLLAVLLVASSPTGTGQGAHRDQLVDLLVPHQHYASEPVAHQRAPRPLAQDNAQPPSVGAGAGAGGLGLTLILPVPAETWVPAVGGSRPVSPASETRPTSWHEAPPKGPPRSTS
jgi:hypothetical protein